MDWPTLLGNPPADVALRYRTGLRRAAGGETLLVVNGDGHVLVEHWQDSQLRRFDAKLAHDEVLAIFGALAKTGYPQVLAQTVPPGAGIIAIEVAGGPDHAPAVLHRSFVRDLPAWTSLVTRLDTLCATASGGQLKPGA